MRRAVASGLLALGAVLVHAPASTARAPAPSIVTTAAPSTTTVTSARRSGTSGGAGRPASANRLPTLGEGFPWIPVGVVVVAAGLVGARLRRAARR